MATLKETANHFGVSIQAMSNYVKKHLQTLNADGEHATVHRGKWYFDEVAIAKLEKLRGFHDGIGEPLTQTPATVDEFRQIISQLQTEVSNLKNRVEQLENKQKSWLNRFFD